MSPTIIPFPSRVVNVGRLADTFESTPPAARVYVAVRRPGLGVRLFEVKDFAVGRLDAEGQLDVAAALPNAVVLFPAD